MTIRYDAQAAALLKQVQVRTNSPLSQVAEQALAALATPAQDGAAPVEQVLTAKQVEAALLQAMPNCKKEIQDSCKYVQGYHCDNTNGQFLTQLLNTRVEKDTAVAYRPPRPRPPVMRRDPYFADIQLDPKADYVMLFNARDVDAKGQPLLMKIIAREHADLSKIDLSNYRTSDNKTDISKFDVMKVKDNADFVQMQDTDEMEFEFGDPLLAVSLGHKGEEISSTVKVAPANVENRNMYYADGQGAPNLARPIPGHNQKLTGHTLDTTHVRTFSDRIRLEMEVKDTAPDGAWLDDKIGGHMDVKLNVDHGYMYEPGSQATVAFLGTQHKLSVKTDDAQLLGTQSASGDVTVAANYTMRNVLTQNITESRHAGPTGTTDTENTATAAWQLIYKNPAKIQVAGADLKPLADHSVAQDGFAAASIKAVKVPRANDEQLDGQTVKLSLGKGFLKGLEEESVKGFKVVAGFVDADGTWKQSAVQTLRNSKESEAMDFSFDVDDSPALHRADTKLEIRVFNDDGVPAERVLIPFRQIGWDAAAH